MRIKNWNDFQAYNDNRPIHWIKLYKKLLDDIEWSKLSGDEAKFLIELWLLASEKHGELPDVDVIAFRLRRDVRKCTTMIGNLVHWFDGECTNLYESVRNRGVDKIREDIDKIREEKIIDRACDAFATFWTAYPRKVNKPGALKAWQNKKLNDSIDIILAGLERWKGSRQWLKDNGQYIPHPATWLNQERWNDEVAATPCTDGGDDDINF